MALPPIKEVLMAVSSGTFPNVNPMLRIDSAAVQLDLSLRTPQIGLFGGKLTLAPGAALLSLGAATTKPITISLTNIGNIASVFTQANWVTIGVLDVALPIRAQIADAKISALVSVSSPALFGAQYPKFSVDFDLKDLQEKVIEFFGKLENADLDITSIVYNKVGMNISTVPGIDGIQGVLASFSRMYKLRDVCQRP